jgi:hypothetical protein
MKPETFSENPERQLALSAAGLLADMQRCLLWMEHENRCAEREEKMGYWLTDHSEEMRRWDAEYMKSREAFLSANNQALPHGGVERTSNETPD